MTRDEIIKTALDRLIESKESAIVSEDFANPEVDFLCEWVINHADDPSIARMWTEYNAIFNKVER